MRNNLFKAVIPLLLIIFSSVGVSAFAVSMPYLEGKTMVLYPGAVSDFEMILQNMVGEQDETAQVVIEEGSDIATITDKKNVYNIPKGTKDTKVHIKIEIPIDTPLGTEWTVRFKATPVAEREGGMVQIAGGISDYFKVKAGSVPERLPPVIEEQNSVNPLWMISVVILVILIVLGLFYYKKRRKK